MPDVLIRGKDIISTPIQRLVISGDAIDRVRFIMDRFVGGKDLSKAKFILKYELPDGERDGDDIREVVEQGQQVVAIWEPRNKSTSLSGRMLIQLEAIIGEGIGGDPGSSRAYVWQSKIVPIHVERTIPIEDVIGDEETFSSQVIAAMSQIYLDTQGLSEVARGYRDEAEGFKNEAAGSVTEAAGYESAAQAASGQAQGFASNADASMRAAQAAEMGATEMVGLARVLYGDLGDITQAVTEAQTQAGKAESAKEDAETAKGQAEAAQGATEQVYGDMLDVYEDLAAVEAARTAAETAQSNAESARDDILEDPGFQGVVANLASILTVYSNRTNISKLAAIDAMITALAAIESDITNVSSIRTSVTQVASNRTNIDAVAGNKANIDEVADNKTNIDMLASIKTEIEALASIYDDLAELGPVVDQLGALLEIREKIDALYDELDSIGEKVNKADYPFEIIDGMVHIVYAEEE